MIHILSAFAGLFTRWYVLAPIMAVLGIAAGASIFIYVSPGKPRIGIIDVPFTVITEESAYVIGEYIDYARRDDSIRAVVVRLSSPGGGASASERLYIETRKLREEKPVVLVMGDLVASGGYMMSMGASYSYAQTSSLVGNVGVILIAGPLIPELPDETTVVSSPYKLDGATRREWVGTVDMLKSAFAEIVIGERGDKLRISREELVEGRIYPGMVAVRLGLVDEIGGDSDAIRKAADLAGISNYDFVNVNLEVLGEFFNDLQRILPSEAGDSGSDAGLDSVLDLLSVGYGIGSDGLTGSEPDSSRAGLRALRELMLHGGLGGGQADPLPEFPMDVHRPNMYYLYVGHGP